MTSDDEDDARYKGAKKLTVDFCENTTAHGLNRIVGAERWWGRVFWAILFCLLAGMMIYQEIEILKDYFGWPVSTTISVVNMRHQYFPAITLCNQNRIKSSLAATSDKYKNLPKIDATMCACRFVGGVGGNSTSTSRRRRDTDGNYRVNFV